MALSPGTRLGSYEVTALIGQGGMGEVYRARDTKLGRDVALKVLSGGLLSPELSRLCGVGFLILKTLELENPWNDHGTFRM